MNVQRVTCINTEGYPVSLMLNAVYDAVPDDEAAKHNLIRIIDESGEDYLYPASYFVHVGATAQATSREFRTNA